MPTCNDQVSFTILIMERNKPEPHCMVPSLFQPNFEPFQLKLCLHSVSSV